MARRAWQFEEAWMLIIRQELVELISWIWVSKEVWEDQHVQDMVLDSEVQFPYARILTVAAGERQIRISTPELKCRSR